MIALEKENWVKNFGIKASVLTIYSSGYGNFKYPKQLNIPVISKYIYIGGEEFRVKEELEEMRNSVSKDPINKGKEIVEGVRKVSDELFYFCKKVNKEFQKYPKEEAIGKYKEFVQKFTHFFGICDLPVFLEDFYSREILKRVREEDFAKLSVYLGESETIKEKKRILEIADELQGAKNISEKIKRKIKALTDEFSWTGMRILLGEPKKYEDFLNKVNEIESPKEEMKKIEEKNKVLKENYKKVLKRLAINQKLKALLGILQGFMFIRDYRYKKMCQSCELIRPFLKEMGKKFNMSYLEFIHLTPEELEQPNEKKKLKLLAQERIKGYAFLFDKGEFEIVAGKELEKLKERFFKKSFAKKLKGFVACKGFTKGEVKIILGREDIKDFKKGQILVTNMTTPDYVEAIEKAAAIVTDIGGVTSHAAIISREFGIPCIIGTKIATQVFKDGDRIEVDANRGVVRRLNENK